MTSFGSRTFSPLVAAAVVCAALLAPSLDAAAQPRPPSVTHPAPYPPPYVPPPPAPVPPGTSAALETSPEFEPYSPAMMVFGSLFCGVGSLASLVGGYLAVTSRTDERTFAVGIGALSGGVALLGAGLPLLVVGAQQVPAGTGIAARDERERLIIRLAPAHAELSLSF